jgi:adenylosuccinate synthase
VHHLFDHDTFAQKFRKVVEGRFKRYGHFEYDTEGEIERYKVIYFIPLHGNFHHLPDQ